MPGSFGHIYKPHNVVRADLDQDLIIQHFEDYFKRLVRSENLHAPNARQRKARQNGLAVTMARALVKGSAHRLTREDLLDKIAALQTVFDDEMTALYDAVLSGELHIENEVKRFEPSEGAA